MKVNIVGRIILSGCYAEVTCYTCENSILTSGRFEMTLLF